MSASDMRWFASHVDPNDQRVSGLATRLATQYSEYSSGGSSHNIFQLCNIFDWVYENITYAPDPERGSLLASASEEVLDPGTLIQIEHGDCDCQAVLLSSLYNALGLPTRLVYCRSPGGDEHMFTEVFAAPAGTWPDLKEGLTKWCTVVSDRPVVPDGFWKETVDDTIWLPMDPTLGEYPGDPRGMENSGFLQEDSFGTVSFFDVSAAELTP